jgi:uncharacterized protein YbjT (DUF2867 family)
MRILLTGGTGHLGGALIPRLIQRGHQLRVLARKPRNTPGVEWIAGDLATGQGLAEAVSRIDVVIHAATSSPIAQRGRFRMTDFFRSPTDVDVEGTKTLLRLAERGGVSHFVHVSIVGLEHTRRLPYSRVKLAAEDAVRHSAMPWSIVRATPFYWLLRRLYANMIKGPLLAVPADVHVQPVDSDDFASWVVDSVTQETLVQREEFAGPQTLTMRESLQQYLDAAGLRRTIWNLPLPRAARVAIKRGQTAPTARQGMTTWREWLATHAPTEPA